jgi:two-component system, cell cycle response regulator CpdR
VSENNRIISIVEDDPSTILFFRGALKGFSGITIITFTDPVLALEHFQDYDYAYVLVISDFKMRGIDGMELLKNIKDSNPFVRTILITAAFRLDNKIFQDYTKKKIINGFIQSQLVYTIFLKR